MAERTEVVSVVECQGALEWRFNPEEIDYWFNRLGIVEARRQMNEQLERALDVAVTRYDPIKQR